MTWAETLLVVVAALVAAVLFVWYWANRVDRLHRRVEATRAALARQLAARAGAALALAYSGGLDPASSVVLAEAARAALDALGGDERDQGLGAAGPAQSELSQTLRVALGGPDDAAGLPGELLGALAAAWYRAALARRFHNEAVAQTQRLRARRGVRVFHLAGATPMPASIEMDDLWPDGLGQAPG